MNKTVDEVISELRLAMEVENSPMGLIETNTLRMLLDEIDILKATVYSLENEIELMGGRPE